MIDTTADTLAHAGRRAAELFVDIFRGAAGRRVAPRAGQAELRAAFAGTLPEQGVGLLRALEEFRQLVVPASLGMSHPLYMGLVNCSPLPAGPLADLLVSSLNNNSGARSQGPAAAAAEAEIVRAFSRLCYGDGEAGGMILPGGSFANLQGLALARSARLPEWAERGPRALPGPPVVYVSASSHFSATRAARVLGVGRDGVVPIPGRGRGGLDAAVLAERVRRDRTSGARPFAVLASAGTTGTGALDPLQEIAAICREHDLWLHVDACYGGAALLLPELRQRFAGIDAADSIALDPHKWFFSPLTTSLLLVREPRHEVAAFDVQATYIPPDGRPAAYRRGLPTSRRASSLTLWLALRAHGWGTIRAAVRRNIELARALERELSAAGCRVLPDGELSVACARWEPEGWSEPRRDRLQEAIARAVVESGRGWFATVVHDGRTWMRFNLLNLHTRERHVREMARLVASTAARLSGTRCRAA